MSNASHTELSSKIGTALRRDFPNTARFLMNFQEFIYFLNNAHRKKSGLGQIYCNLV